uniref:Uncharacterized protein n=1 Tax=Cacopsylla melanoneura TaxID=428564 RepID=A0A8D8SX48_9HEMI
MGYEQGRPGGFHVKHAHVRWIVRVLSHCFVIQLSEAVIIRHMGCVVWCHAGLVCIFSTIPNDFSHIILNNKLKRVRNSFILFFVFSSILKHIVHVHHQGGAGFVNFRLCLFEFLFVIGRGLFFFQSLSSFQFG